MKDEPHTLFKNYLLPNLTKNVNIFLKEHARETANASTTLIIHCQTRVREPSYI